MTTTVSLIVDAAITRLEALDAIARATEGTIAESGTSRAHVVLPAGAIASIDVPKFGEAPPLAIDVRADDLAGARTAADRLQRDLAPTGWPIHRLG